MGEHATREAEVDDLLRRGVFVDLYQVVRQSLQISLRQLLAEEGARVLHGGRRRRARSPKAASRSSSSSASSRPATRRSCRRSATTTPRTAIPRGCCATGCSSARLKPSAQFGADIPWYVTGRRVPRRRLRTTTSIATCATRLTAGRAGRGSRPGARRRGRACSRISLTITGARPNRLVGVLRAAEEVARRAAATTPRRSPISRRSRGAPPCRDRSRWSTRSSSPIRSSSCATAPRSCDTVEGQERRRDRLASTQRAG